MNKMYTCGIDVGSRSTKAVILDENAAVIGRGLHMTGGKPLISADEALREALLAAHLDRDNISSIVATGYGRRLVAGQGMQFTAVTCHAAGAANAFPEVRNVLDIGALRTAVIRLDDTGRVHRFRLNDRCGTGVGRFLERVAVSLEIPLEEIGQLALFSTNPQPVPGMCSVLAETEILNHITHGDKPADILRGVYEAMAERVASLLRQVWIPGAEITLTGGMAKNAGMVKALEDVLGTAVNIHHDSEFMGAIGAALIGRESAEEKKPVESSG